MSFSKISALAGLAAFASTVSAHGYINGIVIEGEYYEGYDPSFQYLQEQPEVIGWTDANLGNGFIAPDAYNTSDIICHLSATPGQATASVAAGGKVELQWTAWPDSHHGPVITYLANCGGDCTTVDKTTLEFFKIDAQGLIDDTTVPGIWATDTLIAQNSTWTVEIPSDIASGSYVLRHEIIALHSAGEADGAQNYPYCVNLEVTGTGTAAPAGVLGTALYNEDDPGIIVNIYATLTTYEIPGPTLYTGATVISQTGTAVVTASATVISESSALIPAPTNNAQGGSGSVATSAAAVAVTTAAASSETVAAVSSTASSSVAAVTPVTAVTPIASGSPYGNGTSEVSGYGSGVVSSTKPKKTACSKKSSSTSAAASASTSAVIDVNVNVGASSSFSAATSTAAPVATSASTSSYSSSAVPTGSSSTGSSSGSTSTGTTSDTSMPSGTTLGDLLSWISSFYSSHKNGEYSASTVAKRQHARDVVKRGN